MINRAADHLWYDEHMSASTDITQKGWTQVDFPLSVAKRAHYAKLGNRLIDEITNDDTLRQAFTFIIGDDDEPRAKQAHTFMVSPALHSADDKLWMHVGYQTRAHVASVIPEADQSPLVREFLDATDELLDAIEQAFRTSLTSIGAATVLDDIFSNEREQRVVHIRIVRYNHARRNDGPAEPVAGHADMGLCTLHLYETHGHWFQAAPYDQSIITDEQTPERQSAVETMRKKLKVIPEVDEQALFFLGAAWKHLPKTNPPQPFQELPACYHAGVRPSARDEFISPYASEVVGESDDRVSLVVFTVPSLDYVAKHPDFHYGSVLECRPDTAVK